MPTNSEESPKPAERRRAPRVAADLPLELKARDAGAPARLKDISRLGLCCRFPEAVPEMTLVEVGIELGEGRRIKAHGAVVRCEPDPTADEGFEVAVFFTDMPGEDRRALEDWLAARV